MYVCCSCTVHPNLNFHPCYKIVIKLHVYSCKVKQVSIKEDITNSNCHYCIKGMMPSLFHPLGANCMLGLYVQLQNTMEVKMHYHKKKNNTCTVHAGFRFNRTQDFTMSQESSLPFLFFLFFPKIKFYC